MELDNGGEDDDADIGKAMEVLEQMELLEAANINNDMNDEQYIQDSEDTILMQDYYVYSSPTSSM